MKTTDSNTKPLTRSDIASLSPTELLIELARRGIEQPDLSVLKATATCPHCDHEGPVEKDFGVRILRGEVKAQSWCRECRANPGRRVRRHSH